MDLSAVSVSLGALPLHHAKALSFLCRSQNMPMANAMFDDAQHHAQRQRIAERVGFGGAELSITRIWEEGEGAVSILAAILLADSRQVVAHSRSI